MYLNRQPSDRNVSAESYVSFHPFIYLTFRKSYRYGTSHLYITDRNIKPLLQSMVLQII